MAAPTPESLAKSGSEHAHQTALFAWAAMNRRAAPELACLFAIPNGGERNKIVAARMVAEGARSGVPDTLLPVARFVPLLPGHSPSQCHGLFIEMKRPAAKLKRITEATHIWERGGVSTEQREWFERLTAQRYKCVVCYSWEEAATELYKYIASNVPQ